MKAATGARVHCGFIETGSQFIYRGGSSRVSPTKDRCCGSAVRIHAQQAVPETGDSNQLNLGAGSIRLIQ